MTPPRSPISAPARSSDDGTDARRPDAQDREDAGHQDGGIGTMTFNNIERRNATSMDM
jgi:hypothetical protein